MHPTLASKCGYCMTPSYKISQPLYNPVGTYLFCNSICLDRFKRRTNFIIDEVEQFMYEVQIDAEAHEDISERMESLLQLQEAYTAAARLEQQLAAAESIIPF